ncbi:MAG: hypothetical protein ACYDA0_13685 [Candidatus Dormibacteraceae bacterium]
MLLALADIALDNPWLGPLASAMVGPSVAVTPVPGLRLNPGRFDRWRFGQKFTIAAPLGSRGPISPIQALRAFLSNGASLIFLALAALVLFPARARVAVERLEDRHGSRIALAAGVAMFLLTLAAITLLRFTLIFLALIPAVLVVALAATLFGIACISLGIGRLVQRRLRLAEPHPLVAALAGALVVFDLAVVPYAGVLALAAVAVGGLGLAIVTRFGSAGGWSFGDLNW